MVVSVTSTGMIEARSPGKAEILARYRGLETSPITILVTRQLPVAVSIASPKREIIIGERMLLRAVAKQADGKTAPLQREEVRWDSTNPNVATLTPNGELIGKAAGTTQITARVEDRVSEPIRLLVKPAPPRNEPRVKTPPPSKPVDVSDRIAKARSLRDQGAYTEALNELHTAEKLDPLNRDVKADIDVTRSACNAERKLGRTELRCQ
jgi:hypothetical protein